MRRSVWHSSGASTVQILLHFPNDLGDCHEATVLAHKRAEPLAHSVCRHAFPQTRPSFCAAARHGLLCSSSGYSVDSGVRCSRAILFMSFAVTLHLRPILSPATPATATICSILFAFSWLADVIALAAQCSVVLWQRPSRCCSSQAAHVIASSHHRARVAFSTVPSNSHRRDQLCHARCALHCE